MTYLRYIVLIGCILTAACAVPARVQTPYDREAKDHLRNAARLEDSKEYQAAEKEYNIVIEQYDTSPQYKMAVRRLAYLNLVPANKGADPNHAIRLLERYIDLEVSPQEKESETLRIAQIKEILRLKDELSRTISERDALKTERQMQTCQLKTTEQKVKGLEQELQDARIQLEEMKEVDLRMHSRRVTGSMGDQLDPAAMGIDFTPEAYSQDLNAADASSGTALKVTQTDRENASLNPEHTVIPEYSAVHPGGGHPYAVQVGSFPDHETALFEALKLKDQGKVSYTSPVFLSGRGEWHRVFIGAYSTRETAEDSSIELKKKTHPDAFTVKLPYAVRVQNPNNLAGTGRIEADLQEKGFMAYRIPDDKNAEYILVGAFRTAEESEIFSELLKKEGYASTTVIR